MRIFLAAAEGVPQHYLSADQFRENPQTNWFSSFRYTRRAQKFLEKVGRADQREGLVTIDSGAHSFFAMAGTSVRSSAGGMKRKVEFDYERYVDRYIRWLQAWEPYYDFFVEVDIQELIGYARVLKWRDEIKSAGLWHKCITCHHSGTGYGEGTANTYEDYVEMVKSSGSRYVAIEGKREGAYTLPYVKLVKCAYDNDCRVHVFAAVDMKVLQNVPVYSTDSRGWGSICSHGVTMRFDGASGKMLFKGKATPMDALEIGAPVSTRAASREFTEKTLYAMKQYSMMQEYYSRYWAARGVDWDGVCRRIEERVDAEIHPDSG